MSKASKPFFARLKTLDFEPPLAEVPTPSEGFCTGTHEPVYCMGHLPPSTLAAVVRE